MRARVASQAGWRAVFAAAALGADLSLAAAQGGEPWFARVQKPEFQPRPVGDGGIVVEVPRKDWQVVPGSGEELATLVEKKKEATVLLERSPLQQALSFDEVTDVFVDLEKERLREMNPGATGFQTKLLQVGDSRRVVVVQFTREGAGGPELVRQYSYPEGRNLYRMICRTQVQRLKKYEPIFGHIAASFRPPRST